MSEKGERTRLEAGARAGDPGAVREFIDVLLGEGDHWSAVRCFRQALAAQLDLSYVDRTARERLTRDPDGALALAHAAYEAGYARAALTLGHLHGVLGRADEAIRFYRAALADFPGEANRRLGITYHALGNIPEARKCLIAAIRHGDAPARISLGVLLYRNDGDFAGAFREFDAAEAAGEDARPTRGFCAFYEKDWEGAERAFAGCMVPQGEHPADLAVGNRGLGLVALVHRRFSEAVAHFSAAIDAGDTESYVRRAMAHYFARDLEAAGRDLEEAGRRGFAIPPMFLAHYHLAASDPERAPSGEDVLEDLLPTVH